MARFDEKNSQYKGVQCHECEGYGHIRTECATFLKKHKKSLTTSWSDDDESEGDGDGERESAKHIATLSSRLFSNIESCEQDLAYDDLAVFHKKLSDRNTDTCKQLEEQKNITNKLENDRISYQAKISELNNKVTLLNSQFSHAMKQVKRMSAGTNPTLCKRMLPHPGKGVVLMRGVNTKENYYLWEPHRKSKNGYLTGMLSMMLQHQVTPKELNIPHLSSINNEKSSQVSCSHEKQSSSIVDRTLETKQLDELSDKFEICPHEKLKELNNSMRVVPHSLLHTNPGFMSQTDLKSPTTRNNSSPIITFSFASSEFKNIHLFASHPFQMSHSFIFTNHHQQHQTNKISFPAFSKPWTLNFKEPTLQFL